MTMRRRHQSENPAGGVVIHKKKNKNDTYQGTRRTVLTIRTCRRRERDLLTTEWPAAAERTSLTHRRAANRARETAVALASRRLRSQTRDGGI